MKVTWGTYPNNLGHQNFPGCFRCHDGNHVSRDENGNEEVISVKCNLCHTVPITGRGTDLVVEAPVIVGNIPDSHTDFRWTISHQSITDADKQACYNCHGNLSRVAVSSLSVSQYSRIGTPLMYSITK